MIIIFLMHVAELLAPTLKIKHFHHSIPGPFLVFLGSENAPPPLSLSLFTLNVDTHTFLLSSHFTFSYHMCERSPPHIFFAQLSLFALFLYFPPNPNSATITVCWVLWSRRRQEPFIYFALAVAFGRIRLLLFIRKKLLTKHSIWQH